MRCMECGSVLRRTSEPIVEEYKGEKISVDGIEHMQCDECGNYEISLENADKLSAAIADEYARRMELLPPSEIRGLRKSLGLSQKEFEKLLGVSSPTVCRWEKGAVQQHKVADNLMRVLRENPSAAGILRRSKPGRYAPVEYSVEMERPCRSNIVDFPAGKVSAAIELDVKEG